MAQRCKQLEDDANATLEFLPHDTTLHRLTDDADAEASWNGVPTDSSPAPFKASPFSGASSKGSDRSRRPTAAYSVSESPNLAGLNLTGSIDPDLAPTVYSGLSSTVLENTWPPWSQMLELWQIYRVHVDPVTKLIHCPTFSEQILLAASRPTDVDAHLRALLFSICYAAIDVVSPDVAETQFWQRREVLASLYKQRMEHALEEASSRPKPSLCVLQALVLHITCRYRRFLDITPADTAMLDLALAQARLLCSEKRNNYLDILSLLETQLLHRCWWALYVLDYHMAAKLGCAPNARLHSEHVPLPLNLNDVDLSPTIEQLPIPRTAITEMSYFLVIVELTQVEAEMRHFKNSDPESVPLKDIGSAVNERVRAVEINFLWHCETSRHLDWLLLLTAKSMLNPIEIQMLELGQTTLSMEEPPGGALNADLSERVFTLILDVIECWYILSTNTKLKPWSWYTGIFHRAYGLKHVESELVKRPESAQRLRAQNLLELEMQ